MANYSECAGACQGKTGGDRDLNLISYASLIHLFLLQQGTAIGLFADVIRINTKVHDYGGNDASRSQFGA
ncbi:MAG: hypothetical protein RL076_2309 [Chloroflexota bacterium]|jgi:hypothetical protein